jgi:hypothetical protein
MPKSFQILIPDSEKSKLIDRIEQDFGLSKASHVNWSERAAGWMKRWENRVSPSGAADKNKPNHTVPLIQWQVFNKLARDMQAMLGDEAEITARATGPADAGKVHKIGRYMTSRVFDQMEITNPLCVFEFRRILNGWAVAHRPWWRREFNTLQNGRQRRVCDYEGPGFFPLEPDDLVVPAERGVMSIQDFSFCIRRYRATVDDLQRGDGTLYQGTSEKEFVKRVISWAQNSSSNDYMMLGQDPVREERERSEGIDYDAFMLGRRSVWVWEWCGSWRPLRKNKRSAEIDDIEKRLPFEADWCVRYIPGMREIVGVQDLIELYPKMRKRRPYVESSLIKDGTYRPKGFGALLADLEDEATANSRLFAAAGELSVWPIVFFKPGGGFNPQAFTIEPGKAYPCEDPASVNVIKITPNLDYNIKRQQDILAVAERVTGITDQSMGRDVDRPNAPRTATGQLALIEEGNIRAYLDATVLREDMEQIVTDFWDLDCDLVPRTEPGLFFRVTGEQAQGLFDVKKGGAFMTAKEFGGTYDFKLKLATSIYARAAKKQELMQFYGLMMQNPLVMQNPRALWAITNKLAIESGIIDFATLVPPPPEMDQPQTPDTEWSKMLEGDDQVHPNPADHDDLHLMQHHEQYKNAIADPDPDKQAIYFLEKHIGETIRQKHEKIMMAALTQQVIQHMQGQMQPGGQGQMQQQMPQQGMPPQGMPPQVSQAGPPGDIPPGPQAVGATMAPVPQDGQM